MIVVHHSTSRDASRNGDPWLVVQAPDRFRGRRVVLSGTELVVGRDASADVQLDDPYVSRTHAVLRRVGAHVVVEDLGSTAGVTVNGHRVSTSAPLVHGDVVGLGDVLMVFRAAGPAPGAARAGHPSADAARFDLRDQRAGVISNVGRDQHISHVAYIQQERASFLREIAGTRTRARYLGWTGVVLFTVGFAVFGHAILGTMARISDLLGSPSPEPPDLSDFYGQPVFGIPSGLIGFAISAIGAILLVLGIVLHVVASARQRRLGHDLPEQHGKT